MFSFKDLIIVCGHYGCGKTNFSINLARYLRESGKKVSIVDLDIVNPYFRTSDYPKLLKELDISLVASHYVHSNLDIPALPPEMYAAFESDDTVIVDVGGDDSGAAALGRFSALIANKGYQMLYLINKYRILTQKPDEALELLYEIEQASRLKVTHLVNNSHLKSDTSKQDIVNGTEYANEVAKASNLPLLLTTAPKGVIKNHNKIKDLFEVDIYVKTDWE